MSTKMPSWPYHGSLLRLRLIAISCARYRDRASSSLTSGGSPTAASSHRCTRVRSGFRRRCLVDGRAYGELVQFDAGLTLRRLQCFNLGVGVQWLGENARRSEIRHEIRDRRKSVCAALDRERIAVLVHLG